MRVHAWRRWLILFPLAMLLTNPLREANKALDDLRTGRFEGAAVLVP